MEKIIPSRQNAKDGKQEYLIQCERGQTELDRSGSWTYSWRTEDDLKVTEEGVVLLPTVANCTHMVGPIMFGCGAKHLSRSSGVSHAFFADF
jgi:hypothetical protein